MATDPRVGTNNWQMTGISGDIAAGGTAVGGGGSYNVAGYRSVVDAQRAASGVGRAPYAEYPDGYLGSVNSRREDRLLKGIQSRMTQRSYQRGIHKGDKIDQSDYFWPSAIIDPQAGIRAEAKGQKWTAKGTTVEQVEAHSSSINHESRAFILTPAELARVANGLGISTPSPFDPARAAKLKRLAPSWR